MTDYKEMDEDGQYNIDLRLDHERALDENIGTMTEFVRQQYKDRVGKDTVKNRFEGYGLLAERYAALSRTVKMVANDMKEFSSILPVDDIRAVDTAANIDNSLRLVIKAALEMSAEARRIGDDLFDMAPPTPLEEYMQGMEGDGFQEVPGTDEGTEDDTGGEGQGEQDAEGQDAPDEEEDRRH